MSAALPAIWLYFSAKTTFQVALVTKGKNLTLKGKRSLHGKEGPHQGLPTQRNILGIE